MTSTRAGLMALALTGWVGTAHALALGEIEIQSHLNQPIQAVIPVVTAKPGELEGAVVELASNEEFERAGMERPEFLSSLRFAVKDNSIVVRSKQIAREPFVTFLLDIRWGGGHLLREYTVLLDPPTMTAQQNAPHARAMTSESKPAPAPAPAPAPTAPSAEAQAAPEQGTAAAPAAETAAPAQAPSETETAVAPAPAPAPAATGQEGGTYGPVSPKETLWSIAYRLRPDTSLTMDQMQVAIFNMNPQAFDHGRLAGLMKGSILRVPTADEVRAVDPVAAKAQVARARAEVGAAPATTAQAPAAPAEAAPPPAEAAPPPSESKVEAAPAPSPPSEAPAPPPPAEEKAPPAENAQAPPPPAEAAPAPKPKPAPAAPAKVEQPSFMSDLLDQARTLPKNPYFLPAAAGFVVLLFLVLGGRWTANKYARWKYERAARKDQAIAPTVGGDMEETQVAPEPAMEQALDEAAAEARATAAPAGMAATLALTSDTMQQTVQQTQTMKQAGEPAAAQTGERKVDFDVTGNFADQTVQINLDAGDPVSEAEFHRAYGLYDEAALLLKQALEKDPKRTDARVKLAEIYFEASKANEFVEVARQLKGELPPAEWQKIALLGTQIAPNNELFSGAGGDVGGTVDLSFDEPAAPAVAQPAAPATDSGTVDFKLEDIQLPETPAAAPAAPAAPAEGGLEFDLGSLSLDTPGSAGPESASAAQAPAPAAPAGGGEEFKLDLGDFDLNAAAPAAESPAPAAAPHESGEVLELGGELTVEEPAAGDESSTKLDLARAYIDMGDNDMAKSLLNEVAQQGSDAQKKEAQELLKRVPA